MKEYTQTELLFDRIGAKNIVVDFTGGTVTSDAGLLWVRQLARGMRIFEKCSAAIRERRREASVQQAMITELRQRVYQIIAGYFHAIDCDRFRDDPALKAVCERLPIEGEALGSQPTMTRLENAVSRTDLYRLARALADVFVGSYEHAPRSIVIDIDDTCDPTHGEQQLSLFNARDNTYCYRPVLVYEGTSGKLITAVLRPGKRPSGVEARAILKRVMGHIRKSWPRVKILLRGDSHFCGEPVMELCESMGNVEYTLGVGKNPVLERLCEQGFRFVRGYQAHADYRHYEAFDYAARSWSRKRRVIARVEVKGPREDVRYIVTNHVGDTAWGLYEDIYCKRGQAENWIKDHKNALRSDLTSCHRFVANQFRLLLHSMAYTLLHEFRLRALRRTELAHAQMDRIRWAVLKIGARVVEKTKCVRLHLPEALAQSPLLMTAYANLHGP
jgi:hypothetical protein